MAVCTIGIITELAPGETLSRQYEVLPSTTTHHPDRTVPQGPGPCRIRDKLGYSPGDGAPGSTLSFVVEFTLEAP